MREFFVPGSAELTEAAQDKIRAWNSQLDSRVVALLIVGHTDAQPWRSGTNQELSERRAEAVAKIIRAAPDAPRREITTEGRGDTEPIEPGDGQEAYEKNRRVEVFATCQ
ncbi:MAG: OmpA family protein [Ilumatobacteraceae bacterium]